MSIDSVYFTLPFSLVLSLTNLCFCPSSFCSLTLKSCVLFSQNSHERIWFRDFVSNLHSVPCSDRLCTHHRRLRLHEGLHKSQDQ
ncbi:hypothetical protein ACFXTO_033038 [Malus domestica]